MRVIEFSSDQKLVSPQYTLSEQKLNRIAGAQKFRCGFSDVSGLASGNAIAGATDALAYVQAVHIQERNS